MTNEPTTHDSTGTEEPTHDQAPTEAAIRADVDKAAATVGRVWPIHSFVTANPLAGFEHLPFGAAVAQAGDLLGGRGYPSPATFRTALETGAIDRDILTSELADRGYDAPPAALLDRMADDLDSAPSPPTDPAAGRVDRVLTKWLAAFLEEGTAQWSMPDREAGFYAAFRGVASHDGEIPDEGVIADLPEQPTETIATVLEPYPDSQRVLVFEEQLAALPGWTGFVKQRAEAAGEWQSIHSITLVEYLAVRLALADAFGVDLEPSTGPDDAGRAPVDELAEAFLHAWEASYRGELVEAVAAESRAHAEEPSSGRPDAQLVFCIDTRSEVIRRHVEATGAYETHGYAGFFGVPMQYRGYDSDVSVDACPPILDPQHHVEEVATEGETRSRYDSLSALGATARTAVEKLKTNPGTAFGFVENAGSGYGLALAARTLLPGRVADLLDRSIDGPDTHEFCDQLVDHQHGYVGDLPVGLTTDEQVEYAATAFELMGWRAFGRLVVFVGHAGESVNNAYDASLDCGACAGNPGGPNARVLAAICNDEAVKAGLRERGIEVPADTVFIAGEHNTTTDEIELYGDVPESHAADLADLRADLAAAHEAAAAERADGMGADGTAGVSETRRRAADWAETRPEWGLAGNAGFVVGPRELTRDLDLDGRCFLHSYDWRTDAEGDALEAILTGPMVVTQWINSQYYFATVDNAVYGSGSKVTQNPVGNVGVYQGNGGDLMAGLPEQSVMAAADEPYHQPLRLSTVVHAPVDRVEAVLAAHDDVRRLLDNEWLSLTVVDPTQEHRAFRYAGELSWTPAADPVEAAPAPIDAPTAADD